jgi:hypothetical protein
MSLQQFSQGEHAVANQTAERAAYTIAEFCAAHRISRSKLYQLWAAGAGPRFMHIGSKKIITVEAAADWRRAGEAAQLPAVPFSIIKAQSQS